MEELFWLALGGGAVYLVLRKKHGPRRIGRDQMPIGAVPQPAQFAASAVADPTLVGPQGSGASPVTSGGNPPDPHTYTPAPGVGIGASYVGAPYRGAVYDPAGTAGGGFGLAAPAFQVGSHASFGGSRSPGGGIGYSSRLRRPDVAYAATWGASPTECSDCQGDPK